MEATAHQAPPDPPELPEGADPEPRWPAWYAGVGFLVGLVGTLLAVGVVAAATGTSSDDESTTFTIVATLVQSLVFIGTAVLFASLTAPPRPWQFGLRRARFWPAVGWAALGIFSFYVFSAIYTAVLNPDIDQGVTESLGADQGTVGLVAAGVMVMVAAPAAEEFFFRGFFYRALRSRLPVIGAALVDGVLFGSIHWDFSSANGLLIVPPLAVLGFIFCLVYERTGSLYPCIALHAMNNSIAYAAQVDSGWLVSVVVGPLMLAACALVPRLAAGPRRAVPALR
jgi:membrane protease YdiL (CAAX protease family)